MKGTRALSIDFHLEVVRTIISEFIISCFQ